MTEEKKNSRQNTANQVSSDDSDPHQGRKNLVDLARKLTDRYKQPSSLKQELYLGAVVGATVLMPIPVASPYPA